MVDRLLNMALLGGEPILYILIALSFISLAVVMERLVAYRKTRINLPAFSSKIVRLLNQQKTDEAISLAQKGASSEEKVVAQGLLNFDKGATVARELMESAAMEEQQKLDKRLTILGTVGSNAPFAGLLGTVLGIIKAFNDLAFNAEGGPSVVMGGIAEALVATAVGLLVAIPAVVFFNYFKNRQKGIMSNVARVQNMVLAFISDNEPANKTVEKEAA